MILNKQSIDSINQWLEIASIDGAMALIDKDKTWTSFDVVAKLRKIFQIKKIGHTGTLDPLASGLLVLCFGKFTKLIENYTGLNKSYRAIIKLGAKTVSDDSETEETDIKPYEDLSDKEITDIVYSFKGEIEQFPPRYSAKWSDGKRYYKLARKNIDFEVKSQFVKINDIKIERISLPYLEVSIDCSKGTYIRSIARDIGDKLGCGAYLFELRRTGIGDFIVDDAVTINDIQKQILK